jgi:hypothetical protein
MYRLRLLSTLLLVSASFCLLPGCSDGPSDALLDEPVSPPTNLRADSDTSSVALLWTLSVSEFQVNFDHYLLTIRVKANDSTFTRTIAKGSSSYKVTGLKNGTRYAFVLRSVSTKGVMSQDSAVVEWAPAVRHRVDSNGGVIRVYANTSSNPPGLDLHNGSGQAELLYEQSTAFAERADLLVTTTNIVSPLVIQSPHKSKVNAGQVTEFSTVPAVDADSFDEIFDTAPPATGTYTAYELTLSESLVSKGKVYYGRVKRGNDRYYFRLLVKRGSNGYLVQGVSIDRYLEFEISYQSVAQVPFAK